MVTSRGCSDYDGCRGGSEEKSLENKPEVNSELFQVTTVVKLPNIGMFSNWF